MSRGEGRAAREANEKVKGAAKSRGLLGGEGKWYKKMNGHGIASVFLAGILLDPYYRGIGL